ncbi:16S rRNA (cytosine(967)-C(5))-methyltransferase RsmB [Chitinispirillales bacterium ANBcel5]|uniref:16S rRNA (cytosine(967)-C(5))-methyltransferase RsmB n=1 Tax=Cellulosispirillum alkaliphilum TaxID=3039283 RepID=UPI002A53CA42|nr:16S rRNA (cytosine(967)-C(5))-methyltransferase RsmB [Chitinispirillales bacterium ANBcel5]
MNTRQLAIQVLSDFDRQNKNLQAILDRAIKSSRMDHRDRRFVFELVYGVVRQRKLLDYIIDKYVSADQGRHSDALRRILQTGVYQIIFMDKVPDHAAVNESVNQAKAAKDTRAASGLVNAVLRNVIKDKHKISLPDPQKDLIERLSVEFSHPRWIVERWLERYGLARTKKLLTFNNQKPSTYLRRKLRDISRQQFEADVRDICDQATGYLNLYYRLKKSLDPENIRLIKHGLCNVQAPSSGWIVALMDIKRGEHILDMCSAPGGKTILMAELLQEAGTVVAAELKLPRLRKVLQTASRMHPGNIYPLVSDGVNPPFTGHFDKVLLDAPCSGTGVLQRHPDGRWARTPEDIEHIVTLQRELLGSAAGLVGEQGVVVYATCSLEPEENEQQVEWFLSNYPEFKLDEVPDSIPDFYVDSEGLVRINPFEHGMDGIFGARFVKE